MGENEAKRNVVISVEEYRELIEEACMSKTYLDKIVHFAKHVNTQVKKGYEIIDVEDCGAILGFEVVRNASK